MAGLLNSNPYGGGLLAPQQSQGLLGSIAHFFRPWTPEDRAKVAAVMPPDLAPTQLVKGALGAVGGLASQATEAMPWGGNNPSAVGVFPDRMAPDSYPAATAGGLDPSVMVPFATDVAGLATTGALTAPAVKNATGMGIRAYHGSPHDFDRFSMDKIGTGEGAQAYGHGLYFAENEGVARSYRDALSRGNLASRKEAFGLSEEATDWLRSTLDEYPNSTLYDIEQYARGMFDPWDEYDPKSMISNEIIDALKRGDIPDAPRGRMYEVDINASPDEFLDWDKPLFKQGAIGERVRDVMEGILGPDGGATSIYNSSMGIGGFPRIAKGPDFAEALRAAGIKGIRYKDAGSRGTDSAGGTSNYVVFDDNIIDILKKYGIAGLMAGGAGAAALGSPDPASASAPTYTTGGRF